MNKISLSLKNIIFIVLLLGSTIAVIVLQKFSIFSFVLLGLDLISGYYFLYKNISELPVLALCLNLIYICLYLSIFNQVIFILILAVVIYLILITYIFKSAITQVNILALIISFLAYEIIYVINIFSYLLMVKSLFILLFVYLFYGLVKLNVDHNLRLFPILRYCLVFVALMVILFINNKYFLI